MELYRDLPAFTPIQCRTLRKTTSTATRFTSFVRGAQLKHLYILISQSLG